MYLLKIVFLFVLLILVWFCFEKKKKRRDFVTNSNNQSNTHKKWKQDRITVDLFGMLASTITHSWNIRMRHTFYFMSFLTNGGSLATCQRHQWYLHISSTLELDNKDDVNLLTMGWVNSSQRESGHAWKTKAESTISMEDVTGVTLSSLKSLGLMILPAGWIPAWHPIGRTWLAAVEGCGI